MMHAVLFTEDGVVTQVCSGPREVLQSDLQNRQYLESTAAVIPDDVYVDFNPLTLRKKPPRPSHFHVWKSTSNTWQFDFATARKTIRQEWDQWLVAKLAQGYTQDEKTYALDSDTVGAISLLQQGPGNVVQVRLLDNSRTNLTQAQLKLLVTALVDARQTLFVQMWNGKDAVESAISAEEVYAARPPAL